MSQYFSECLQDAVIWIFWVFVSHCAQTGLELEVPRSLLSIQVVLIVHFLVRLLLLQALALPKVCGLLTR